ncbi:transposase [Parathermosynechococcus lividus]
MKSPPILIITQIVVFSGVVEGINNKLKLIKRSGDGFRNFDNVQLRCLICWYLAID